MGMYCGGSEMSVHTGGDVLSYMVHKRQPQIAIVENIGKLRIRLSCTMFRILS